MRIRSLAFVGALALAAVLSMAGGAAPAAPAPTPAAVSAAPPLPWLLESTPALSVATASCGDYGFYEHNELDKCKKECQGNRKQCVKRQRCGSGDCPEPGYCWACTKQ
jgi:hypothetical protein